MEKDIQINVPTKLWKVPLIKVAVLDFKRRVTNRKKCSVSIFQFSDGWKKVDRKGIYLLDYIDEKMIGDFEIIPDKLKNIPESFFIHQDTKRGQLFLIGNGIRGIVYGLFRMVEYLILYDKFPKEICEAPAFQLRLASVFSSLYTYEKEALQKALRPDGCIQLWDSWFKQIDTEFYPFVREDRLSKVIEQFKKYCKRIVGYGVNGIVLGNWLHMTNFDALKGLKIYPEGSIFRKRNKAYEKFYNEIFNYAKGLCLDMYIYSDQFSYTAPMKSFIGSLNCNNPKLWKIYRAGYEEIFQKFPQVDGIMIRYGQHDPSNEYMSLDIFGKVPIDANKWGDYNGRPHDMKKLARLIKESLRVCNKFNKRFIFRTWTQTEIDLHSRIDLYVKLIDQLKDIDKTNLIFSVKRTKTDFWHYQELNPTLGIGDIEQMVEVECRREFEGMGMFPAFWGEDNQKGLKASLDRGVKHIWFWPGSGGWITPNYPVIVPFICGFDKWIEANVYQIYRLIWDPEEKPEITAYQWGVMNYGPKAGSIMRKILLTSYKVIKNSFYISTYAKNRTWKTMSPIWHMPWLCIDTSELGGIYVICKQNMKSVLEESRETVKESTKMIDLFKLLKTQIPRKLYQDTLYSLKHLNTFVKLLHHFRSAFLYYYSWQENNSREFKSECKTEIENTKKYLREYNQNFGKAITGEIKDFLLESMRGILGNENIQ